MDAAFYIPKPFMEGYIKGDTVYSLSSADDTSFSTSSLADFFGKDSSGNTVSSYRIDAACYAGTHLYLFYKTSKGELVYARFDPTAKSLDHVSWYVKKFWVGPYALATSSGGSGTVDAAFQWHDNSGLYFFSGVNYCKVDFSQSHGPCVAPPRPYNQQYWRGVWQNLAMATSASNGNTYFYYGTEVAMYDAKANKVASGYPKSVVGGDDPVCAIPSATGAVAPAIEEVPSPFGTGARVLNIILLVVLGVAMLGQGLAVSCSSDLTDGYKFFAGCKSFVALTTFLTGLLLVNKFMSTPLQGYSCCAVGEFTYDSTTSTGTDNSCNVFAATQAGVAACDLQVTAQGICFVASKDTPKGCKYKYPSYYDMMLNGMAAEQRNVIEHWPPGIGPAPVFPSNADVKAYASAFKQACFPRGDTSKTEGAGKGQALGQAQFFQTSGWGGFQPWFIVMWISILGKAVSHLLSEVDGVRGTTPMTVFSTILTILHTYGTVYLGYLRQGYVFSDGCSSWDGAAGESACSSAELDINMGESYQQLADDSSSSDFGPFLPPPTVTSSTTIDMVTIVTNGFDFSVSLGVVSTIAGGVGLLLMCLQTKQLPCHECMPERESSPAGYTEMRSKA